MKKIVLILALLIAIPNLSQGTNINVWVGYTDIYFNTKRLIHPDSIVVQDMQTGEISNFGGSIINLQPTTDIPYDNSSEIPLLISYDSKTNHLLIKSMYYEKKKVKCEIYDYYGKILISNDGIFEYDKEFSINMNNYSIGIYFLRFSSNQWNFSTVVLKTDNSVYINGQSNLKILNKSYEYKITAYIKKLSRELLQIKPSITIYEYNPDKETDTVFIDSDYERRWFNYEANIQLDSIHMVYDYKHDSYYYDKNGSKYDSVKSHSDGYVSTNIKYKKYETADIKAFWSSGYYWDCCDGTILQPTNWDNINIYNVITSHSTSSDYHDWICSKQYLRFGINSNKLKIDSLELLNWYNYKWRRYTTQDGINNRLDVLSLFDVDYTIEGDTIIVELSGDKLFYSMKSYNINTREYRNSISRSDQKVWTDNYYHNYTIMKSDPASKLKIKIWQVK